MATNERAYNRTQCSIPNVYRWVCYGIRRIGVWNDGIERVRYERVELILKEAHFKDEGNPDEILKLRLISDGLWFSIMY